MRRTSPKLTLALAAALAACGGWHEEADVRDEGALPADLTTVRVRVPLGSVTVQAGPDGRYRIAGRSRKAAGNADDLERLRGIDFRAELRPTDVPGVYDYVFPSLPDGVDPRDAALMLRAELFLPRAVAVDVETERGNLGVVGRDAAVRLHTGSGEVQLDDVRGDVSVFTGLGAGILHHVSGSIDFESGGGAVVAWIDAIGPGGVRIETREPSVTCYLPDGASCELDARVVRSNVGKVGVRNAFGLPVTEDGAGHVARGTVGAPGGPPVQLRAGSGWVSVTTSAAATGPR